MPEKNRIAAVLVIVLLIAAPVAYFLLKPPVDVLPPAADKRDFVERAVAAGITFRMQFLPNEQGENFKVNLYDHGTGVAVADFDGDGFDDIYFVNQLGTNGFFRNKGDGAFTDVTQAAGVGVGDRICVAAVFADYDNDGDQDLYVTSTRGGNILFQNLGNGKFQDVTKQAGLTHVGHSQAAVFFDFDNDGHLDLYLVNTAEWTNDYDPVAKYYPGPARLVDLAPRPKEWNVLYRNNGNGTFTDVTKKASLAGQGWGADATAFDYDEDGRPDLLVTSMFGRSQLYRNQGDGTFTDVTMKTLGPTPWGGIGARALDFNNDGKLDLFIVDMHSDMWTKPSLDLSVVQAQKKYRYAYGPLADAFPEAMKAEQEFAALLGIRYDEVVFGNGLYKNLGKGKFEEVSEKAGMETFWPWGIADGDFNNDGHLDVFIPAGMGYPFAYWPSSLMMNNGNETFTDRAGAAGIEPPNGGIHLDRLIGGEKAARGSRTAAVADFDRDGRLDLIVNNFNDRPYLLQNQMPRQNYLALRLRGVKSNRDAIGAVVHVHRGKEILTRVVPSAGGYLAQASRTLHFGLGDSQTIDRVEIRWPSGIRQKLGNPRLNTVNEVQEPPGL